MIAKSARLLARREEGVCWGKRLRPNRCPSSAPSDSQHQEGLESVVTGFDELARHVGKRAARRLWSFAKTLGNASRREVAIAAVLAMGHKKQKQLLSELEQAEASDDELLAVYRDQLDREISIKRQDSWVLPLLALLPLTLLDTQETATTIAVGALMALLFAQGLWVRFSVLPRLLRNREALS